MSAQVQVSESQKLVPIERRHGVLSLTDMKGDRVHDGLIQRRHLVRLQTFCIKKFVNGARRHRRHKHTSRVCPLIVLRGRDVNRARSNQGNQVVRIDWQLIYLVNIF